ncbi:type VI secretion system baseplate subunit TssF (plasmid) [Xenorhabdus sp. SF857]|uniref:type VI secretion system baseplate subunit TssF n=1 Tax=Xenorhabdus bakwenae TaxID=3026967 RepID=UPI002557DF2B|nr:type VI secretion system baseplate subunit TssF [Xenorhabdus sp. SF857]WFQ78127.1 type VI secretion system baseplate subunit TssF [Xenorhabdus sp. SF857]
MKNFEDYFQHEIEYLRALQRLVRQEKPHLADILSGHDPDVEKLHEGFAFLTARLHQKIDDGIPEYSQPLLQRLHSQVIKGIPATSIVQLKSKPSTDTAYSVPINRQIITEDGTSFITCRACDIEPLEIVRREIQHQTKETRLTLTFRYTGKDTRWKISPINLFLSADEIVAETLMLALTQEAGDIQLHEETSSYPMNGLSMASLQGTSRLILSPPQRAGNWAPQMLMESLYLPHVHHFITLALPTTMRSYVLMAEAREFTVTIPLNCELAISEAQMAEAFHLHCVPVVNRQSSQLTVPFTPETERYSLPLPSAEGLLDITDVELEHEPDEEHDRGNEFRFYPDSLLTGMDRFPENEQIWFYSLEVSEDALGRFQYDLIFRDSRGQVMTQPPARKFICQVTTFRLQAVSLGVDERCYVDETLPDNVQIKNLTLPSLPYPPLTDSHRYWTLLSHYSSSPFLLYSVNMLKELLHGYDFYTETDRNRSRTLRSRIGGLVAVHSKTSDWLIKGIPHRCLFIELILDDGAYSHEGEAFMFAHSVSQFLPFCLTQDMHMLVTCRTTAGKYYGFSRYPIQGYRPLM